MAATYIELTNRLRDRFGEVRLVSNTTWGTAVGFDQFTKDAINYAYRDIINSELEWPFTHISATLLTTAGKQVYDLLTDATFSTPSGGLVELDTIDWDSFYNTSNMTVETFTAEAHTIPSSGTTRTVVVDNFGTLSTITGKTRSFYLDVAVTVNGVAATRVHTTPSITGQYSLNTLTGTYAFSVADDGKTAAITYKTVASTPNSNPAIQTATFLPFIDYDNWRQNYTFRDLNSLGTNYSAPEFVFPTQITGQVGLSPIPDQVYNIICEFWIDAVELVATTDVPIIPSHWNPLIIDGAQKYVYEFREDAQMAAMAANRFKSGVEKMRTELINRQSDMRTGFHWNPNRYVNTLYVR